MLPILLPDHSTKNVLLPSVQIPDSLSEHVLTRLKVQEVMEKTGDSLWVTLFFGGLEQPQF